MGTADRLAYLSRRRSDATARLLGDVILVESGEEVAIVDVPTLDDDLRYAIVISSDGREWDLDEDGIATTDGAIGTCGALSRDPSFDPRL